MRPPLVEVEEHTFNDDLLIPQSDQDSAHRYYPRIAHVLDFPALRKEFAKYECAANKAKKQVRLHGLVAVCASTLALLALVTRPIWPHATWTRLPAGIFELSGMCAALFAIGGLWSGKLKRRWLGSRLMTERLRQWHFQFIVRHGSEIDSSCNGQTAQFKLRREEMFGQFIAEYKGKLDNQLETMIHDPLEGIAWLHPNSSSYDPQGETLRDILIAYERLRFRHQYGFATYKLEAEADKPFWRFLHWPANAQRSLLSGLSSSCFAIALILSAILICIDLLRLPEGVDLYLRTSAIAVAILGAALRTIQEGLGLDSEIERYREYQEKIARLYDRFQRTSGAEHRLRLMADLEYVSVEEMQGFLRAHHRARWVLA